MEFIKNKYFLWGIFTGLLWTIFGVITIVVFLSDASIESSLITLYQQNKLGGLISIASLITTLYGTDGEYFNSYKELYIIDNSIGLNSS